MERTFLLSLSSRILGLIPVRWFRIGLIPVCCLFGELVEWRMRPPPKKKQRKKNNNTTYDCHGIQYVTLSLPWKSWSMKLFMGHRKGKWKRKKTLLESRQQYMGKWCLGCLLSLYHSYAKRRAVVSAANDVTGCWRRDQALMVLLSTVSLLFMSRILRALHKVLNQFVDMKPKLRISVPSGLYHPLCPYLFERSRRFWIQSQ